MIHDVINDVTVFIEVINSGSFVGAAHKIGISKPSVSRQINQLESRLKTKLIKRTTRKLSLTEAGQILYDRCKNFDDSLSGAIAEIANLRECPTGKLKIGFSSYFANDYRAMKTIADFMVIHPGISIELHSFTTSNDIDLIKKDFDLYFTDNDMTDAHLTSTLIQEYPIKLCATPAYLQKNSTPKKPDDLINQNCLLHFLYEKPITDWCFQIDGEYHSVKVNGSLYASRTHILLKMARAGAGIAQLPLFMVEKYLQKGELISILNEFPIKSAQVYATTYRQKEIPKKLNYFLKYMRARYRI
ncbi:MAG: LysR family transcriptional regulator [Gammaproteobacteria bacterium]|nr:LysR family transcriptional regulator [Gammaproteobacteria bacterium]